MKAQDSMQVMEPMLPTLVKVPFSNPLGSLSQSGIAIEPFVISFKVTRDSFHEDETI